jgi:Integrase core domain
LAPVPHWAGQSCPGGGLCARGHRVAQTDLCADRGRARFSLNTSVGSNRTSDRGVDRSSRPQPPDGPHRPRYYDQVSAPGPRLSVHQGLRCGLRRGEHPDPHQPTRGTRANAICERLIGTLHRELLERILIINERHLRRILTVYLDHFNEARPHRALAHLAPAQAETRPPLVINLADHQVRRRLILNGLISEYQIAA